MKKTGMIALIILLAAILTACKVSPTDEAVQKSAETPQPEWSYTWLSKRCFYDNGYSDLICRDINTGDDTLFGNLIAPLIEQGYELDEIVHTSSERGIIQTFIFRKPYVAPVAQE